MCDECDFHGNCLRAASICREILWSGNFKGMTARFYEQTKDCELFIPRERARFA